MRIVRQLVLTIKQKKIAKHYGSGSQMIPSCKRPIDTERNAATFKVITLVKLFIAKYI
jgi:hypothetical protein